MGQQEQQVQQPMFCPEVEGEWTKSQWRNSMHLKKLNSR